MKAIVQDRYGAPQRVLKLEEVDRLPVGDDDVPIRVCATSVNAPDWIMVTGVPYLLRLRFGLRRPPTPVRGTDVAEFDDRVFLTREWSHRRRVVAPPRGLTHLAERGDPRCASQCSWSLRWWSYSRFVER